MWTKGGSISRRGTSRATTATRARASARTIGITRRSSVDLKAYGQAARASAGAVMRQAMVLSLLSLVVSSTACGGLATSSGTETNSVDAGPLGEGGCIVDTPTQGAPCNPGQSLCYPHSCARCGLSCDPSTHEWSAVTADCVCVQEFACGPQDECSSSTQYCREFVGPLSQPTTYSCVTMDAGGQPSCQALELGAPVMSPGACGCFESDAGEVTVTYCSR
jgi:hypothetical protein